MICQALSCVNIPLQVEPTTGVALEEEFEFTVAVSTAGVFGTDVQYFLTNQDGDERELAQRQASDNEFRMSLASGEPKHKTKFGEKVHLRWELFFGRCLHGAGCGLSD